MTAAPERSSAFRLIAEQRRDQPDVVLLARSLCLAAQAEPYFLRGARLRFLPRSGIGLEARLWFSPLVEAADSRALVLNPEVSAELRQELSARDLSLLGSVREYTRTAHRSAPPLVRAFEDLLWRATIGPRPAEAEVEEALAPLFRQVLAEGAGAADASRWVLRFLPRLPEDVHGSWPAWRLQVMAAERLGMEPPTGVAARTDADRVRAVRSLVHSEVDIGVRPVADGLVLTRPPEPDALVCPASGAARVRLRLRAALPGAGWHELDMYADERAALRLGVIAEALPDGTVLHARAELGGTLACVRAAGRGATAVTADGRTALSVDDGETVLPLELPEAPTLLAVADAGPAATAALTGSGLHVVSTALDGTADAVLHRFPAAAAEPTALGWSRLARQTVLCLVSGTDVVLAADGDPRRELARLTHSARVVGLWSSVRAGTVAVADARGDLVVHRPASGTGPPTTLWGTGQAITALTGDPASGAVVWATEDGRVHAWRPDGAPEAGGDGVDGAGETATGRRDRDREEDDWDVLAVLPAPATSLAVSPESGLVVAADGGPRLLRLPWPEGGPATGAPVPFPVREVCPAPSGRLLLTGHGGEVEIRSEDGRAHLFTPAPVPAAPGGAGPAWLRDSVGVVLPASDPRLPSRARRWGLGHVCLPASCEPGAPGTTALVEEARAQGLRLLACLDPPDGTAAHGPLLRRAYDLLEEGLDGLRLREAARWPEPLLIRLRHLLDAFPGAALVGVADGHEAPDGPEPASGSAAAAAHCHLLVGAPPGVPAAAPGPLSPWALPPGTPYPEACLLLALPGCHEVPFAVLDAATPRTTALRTLLAARASQLALHGEDFTFLPTGDPRLTAVRRSHAGQTVLCLTSTADTPVLARIPVPDPEPAAAFVEIAHDIPAPHPAADEPETVRAAEGVLTLPLGPGRTRWFRLRPAQHSRSAEATDPFGPPTP
ncbi:MULTISPECIES: hypothetical protein [unclassified Streptomyces]|uniref:hypothetical protein n=1 Tax=unclassified Streptomyces TaxID=2593676 RepID=UPI001F3B0939|nr:MULTISPECIES: hypothetical protein [unclassified Streptomyces]MCF0089740.1 hypothetical protein [Streptomyces sp. MH192]MCF0102089.1 hypothetical protein [Streptomyces sp. MH191]